MSIESGKVFMDFSIYWKTFSDGYTWHKYISKHVNKKNSTRLSDFVWKYFDKYGT